MSPTETGGCDECSLTSEVCQLLLTCRINRESDVLKCIEYSGAKCYYNLLSIIDLRLYISSNE